MSSDMGELSSSGRLLKVWREADAPSGTSSCSHDAPSSPTSHPRVRKQAECRSAAIATLRAHLNAGTAHACTSA
eukprot:1158427-Pelagomonas_calceolata.AAC.5